MQPQVVAKIVSLWSCSDCKYIVCMNLVHTGIRDVGDDSFKLVGKQRCKTKAKESNDGHYFYLYMRVVSEHSNQCVPVQKQELFKELLSDKDWNYQRHKELLFYKVSHLKNQYCEVKVTRERSLIHSNLSNFCAPGKGSNDIKGAKIGSSSDDSSKVLKESRADKGVVEKNLFDTVIDQLDNIPGIDKNTSVAFKSMLEGIMKSNYSNARNEQSRKFVYKISIIFPLCIGF